MLTHNNAARNLLNLCLRSALEPARGAACVHTLRTVLTVMNELKKIGIRTYALSLFHPLSSH